MIRRNAHPSDPKPAPSKGSPPTDQPQSPSCPSPLPIATDVELATEQMQRASLLRSAGQPVDTAVTRLDSTPPALDFPTDFARSSESLCSRSSRERVLSHSLFERLNSVPSDSSAIAQDWLLSAWASLIYRYTSSDDFAIGLLPIPDALTGTSDSRVADHSGIALRFQLHGNTAANTPAALAEAISQRTRSLDSVQDALLETVLQPLELPIQFGFVPAIEYEPAGPNNSHSLEDFVAHHWCPQTELQITFGLCDGTVRIDYLTSLWRPEFIDRMLGHFETLLDSMLHAPEVSLSKHRLLTDAEWQQIVVQWNCNSQSFPLDRSIHALIVDQSLRTPDAIAVVCEEDSLTYRELDDKSDRVAHHLQSLGVVPGSLVGLSIEQSTHVIVAILGILKAGAAYVPLDIKHPADRIQSIVHDAGLEIVVTSTQLAPRLPIAMDQMVLLDALLQTSESLPANERFHAEVTSDHLAYVLYTSGTTGRPKGVAIPHRAVVNFLCAMAIRPGLKPGERLLSITSPSFDISVLEMLMPLIVGATVEVVPTQHIKDPAALAEALQRSRAQMMQATPTTWQMMILHGWTGHPNLKLVTGGEALSDALAAQLMQRCDELWNQYGPTETTVYMTQYLVPPGGPNRNIGKPIANCQVYILDPDGNPVPVGVTGEIYVGGEPLARGYLHRDDLTAEKFIRNPFTNTPNARIYQTGDLGRWTVDGYIECLGRIDHQVKLRGYRIELKEIESWLNKWPGTRESVVRLREDIPGDPRLVAYCVFPEATRPNDTEVVEYLHQKLPEYMVPSDFVWLDYLPLTVNGKIDVKALPKPDRSNRERVEQYVAPRTPLETLIAEVFQSILGVPQIGIHDSFFAFGGHSLSAVRAIVRIREQSGYPIRVRMLFEHPTVDGLAAHLTHALGPFQKPVHATAVPGLPNNNESAHSIKENQTDPAPLSFAQMRLWLVDEIENGTNAYNIPRAYRLRGTLDPTALSRAIERLIERHEPLRTTFRAVEGSPVQCVLESPKIDLAIESLESVPTALLSQSIQSRFEQLADQRFHLAHDVPFRAMLLRISPVDHVLITNTHHIASDDWSVDIFNTELSIAYGDTLHGRPCSLPSLPSRYIDYALQQRRELTGTHYESMLDYWKSHLQGMPTLDLPHDFPRPLRPSHACGQHRMQFDPELVASLHSIARDCQCTLHMVFLAAFQCLLHKWSRQDDICIGMPIAGRLHEDLEPLIGFFVNTLVIRGDLSGNPTFKDLLQRVRTTSLAAYDHQEMPFDKLVEELQPDRAFNSTPLVQVLFQLTNFNPSTLNLEGLTAEPLDLDEPRLRFDLEVYVTQRGDSLTGSIHFARELFEPETIARLAQQYLTLLESIAATPEQPISELEWISQRDTQRVLIEWNDTHSATPEYANITQWIDAQTELSPDATALEFEGHQLSYRQLQHRSQSIADAIASACPTAPRRIGIMMDRSIDLIAGILGIIRSGAAVVPIDPAYPELRRHYILADAKIDLLLTHSGMTQPPAETNVPILHVDALRESILDPTAAEHRPLRTTPEDSIYILYTSGSTGQPKGVEMPHRAMLNLVQWHRSVPRLQRPARTLQFATCNFDVSFQEILTTLCTGGTLVLVCEDVRRDPEELWRHLTNHHVERVFLPFVMLQQLATACKETAHRIAVPPLQDIVSAGEALLFTSELQHLLDRLPDCKLHNHYGPTESHVITSHLVTDRDLRSLRESPIGKPISNSQVYVLDAQRKPLPPGIPGDLWLAGDCLAHGYVDRPEWTESRFMHVSLPQVGTKRMYQSGDTARWNNHGELLYLGRSDDQVKHRGVRIELGEIEARLLEHPGIAQAAVAIQSTSDGLQRLCAYYVAKDGVPASHGDLQAFLRQRLPDAMIPNAWAALESFPLTASGKLDRRALPKEVLWQTDSVDYVEPSTSHEILIAAIWSNLFAIDRVSALDHFFSLGGHSLLAARMRSRLERELGFQVPLRRIFEFPVLRAFAKALSEHTPDAEATQSDLLPRNAPPGNTDQLDDQALEAPLSFAQSRLWLIDQLESGTSAYNVPTAYRIRGPLHHAALETALERVIQRHEPLRTHVLVPSGTPIQRVSSQTHGPIPVDSVQNRNPAALDRLIQEWFTHEVDRPFALNEELPIRFRLLRIDSDDHVLLINIHHIAVDGWSLEVFNHDFATAFRDALASQPCSLQPLPMRYVDYARQQHQLLAQDRYPSLLDYWKQQLQDLPHLDLPHDRPRSQRPSFACGQERLHFSPPLLAKLASIAQEAQCTLHMVFLAAFQCLLQKWSRQDDICIGMPIAGRTHEALEPLVGFFVNTLVIREDLSGDPTFKDLLQRVRTTSLAAYDHQEMPFDKLVEELQPDRTFNGNPLVQVLFQLLHFNPSDLTLDGLDVQPLDLDEPRLRFDLEVHLIQHDDTLVGSIHFARELFEPETIARLAQQYLTLLESIAAAPGQPISELEWISQRDTQRVLIEWNDTQTAPPDYANITQWIDAQTELSPDAIALEFEGHQLSYRQLQHRSQSIADAIASACPSAPRRIGIMMDRSIDLIAGILAIIRSGAAVVPIDPAYPELRRHYILADAKIDLLLTHSTLGPIPSDCPTTLLFVDSLHQSETGTPHSPLEIQNSVTSEDSIYILYTSGSTGQPKGVEMPHRAMLNLVQW
ncbi:MAG: amino acid adenylation domain-containing protein, partial [Pirellula sp.]